MEYSSRVRNQSNRVRGYFPSFQLSLTKLQRNAKDSHNYWEGKGAMAFNKVDLT